MSIRPAGSARPPLLLVARLLRKALAAAAPDAACALGAKATRVWVRLAVASAVAPDLDAARQASALLLVLLQVGITTTLGLGLGLEQWIWTWTAHTVQYDECCVSHECSVERNALQARSVDATYKRT